MKTISTETALAYLDAGLCVLPAIRAKKLPPLKWRRYQTEFPTADTVRAWFSPQQPRDAVCVLTGAISGGLECIDFDHKAAFFPAWRDAVVRAVGAEAFAALAVETTQSGGKHVFFRCQDAIEGNQPLAYGPDDGKRTAYIETRGEGGLVVCSPTEGYTLEQGSLLAVPEVTPLQRAALLDAARALDVRRAENAPVPGPSPEGRGPSCAAPGPSSAPSTGGGTFDLNPGDDFNLRAPGSGAFAQLLVSYGWRKVGERDGNEAWQRPGKTGDGQSATFNGTVFYVFSSNALPFEPNQGYSPFKVYTLLAHGGDYTAAARTLFEGGWGRAAQVDETPIRVFRSSTLRAEEPPAAAPAAPEAAEPAHDAKPRIVRKAQPPARPDPRLYSVPGFIDALASYTMRTAYTPNRPLAFAGALAFLAMVAGRRYVTRTGTHPNLYLLALAPSGTGKERPRQVNQDLARKTGLLDCLGDSFSSGPGLVDALRRCPVRLYQRDEATQLFSTLSASGDARILADGLTSMMLNIYSSADGVITRGDVSNVSRRGDHAPAFVVRPSLSIFGTATPGEFYDALTPKMIGEGLAGRFLVVEADPLGEFNRMEERESMPRTVVEHAKKLLARGKNVHADDFDPDKDLVPVDFDGEEARAARMRLLEDNQERRKKLAEKTDVESLAQAAIYVREMEKTEKLALLYALSENAEGPHLTAAGYEWASAFVRAHQRLLFERVRDNVGGTEEAKLAQRILAFLRERGGSATASAVTKRFRHNARAQLIREAVNSLVESEAIAVEQVATSGRYAKNYVLKEETEDANG
jgi:hypothetical protein